MAQTCYRENEWREWYADDGGAGDRGGETSQVTTADHWALRDTVSAVASAEYEWATDHQLMNHKGKKDNATSAQSQYWIKWHCAVVGLISSEWATQSDWLNRYWREIKMISRSTLHDPLVTVVTMMMVRLSGRESETSRKGSRAWTTALLQDYVCLCHSWSALCSLLYIFGQLTTVHC